MTPYKKKEVNHKYNKLIGSQYLNPLCVESGSYCFRRETFLKERSRITKKNHEKYFFPPFSFYSQFLRMGILDDDYK